MVFQLVRNTTAIWRNAARYCWFKMDLFISKLYTNPARERKTGVKGHHNGTFPPTALQHSQAIPDPAPERDPAMQRGLSAAPAWKEGQQTASAQELRADGPSPSTGAASREGDPWERGVVWRGERRTQGYSLPPGYTPACSIPKGTSGCL